MFSIPQSLGENHGVELPRIKGIGWKVPETHWGFPELASSPVKGEELKRTLRASCRFRSFTFSNCNFRAIFTPERKFHGKTTQNWQRVTRRTQQTTPQTYRQTYQRLPSVPPASFPFRIPPLLRIPAASNSIHDTKVPPSPFQHGQPLHPQPALASRLHRLHIQIVGRFHVLQQKPQRH